MAKEIEQRIYAALGVSKSLVVPIDRLDEELTDALTDAPIDAPIDFEREAAAISIADERAA
jgi:hypothetical protein